MTTSTLAPIPEFEGRYAATDGGQILSLRSGRILSSALLRNGYLMVSLSRDGRGHSTLVHRVIAEAFHGPRPEGAQIRHLNGDRTDNRPANLAYGSASDNMQDRIAHGRNPELLKTHCPSGHAYDSANTIVHPNGWRSCRACKRARDNRAYAARRSA